MSSAQPLPRADRLKEPPVVGQWYLVPAILWDRDLRRRDESDTDEEILRSLETGDRAMWWPVWGRKHSDVEHFSFHPLHYHIDPRFLTRRHTKGFWSWSGRTSLQNIQAQPLSHVGLSSGPPKPTLRRMRCSVSHAEWGHPEAAAVQKMNDAYAGRQCRSGKRGFVCPHRQFPLGSIEAIDGIVTCPLHGLRIDAVTGKCLGPADMPQRADGKGRG